MGVSSNLEVFLSEKQQSNNNKDRGEFIIIATSVTRSPAMEEETNDQEQSHHASTEQDHHDDDLNPIKTKQQTVHVQEQQQKSKDNNNNNVQVVLQPYASPVLNLTIKIPPYNVEEEETEKEGSSSSDDGFKTPTGTEHRIPPMLECPPAPRKPKTTPSSTAKRKGCYRRRSPVPLIDFSQDFFNDSMFPITPPSTVDRGANSCSGKKNKKVNNKLFTDDEEPPPQ